MSKHRSRKKYRKPYTSKNRNVEASNNITTFFSTILPFIEDLEKEDELLLVLPSIDATVPGGSPATVPGGSPSGPIGIVIGSDLALSINADYIQRMADYTRQCGSLEAYYDFRARNPKWAAKHNPDWLLLNICRAARLVIAYRYGLALGNAEYVSGLTGTAEPSPESPEEHRVPEFPSLDSLPLFITMMGDSDDVQSHSITDSPLPQSIGYELNGEITLEEYKPRPSES